MNDEHRSDDGDEVPVYGSDGRRLKSYVERNTVSRYISSTYEWFNERWAPSWWLKLTNSERIQCFILLATAIYALFAAALWCSTTQQSRLARQSLELTTRAFQLAYGAHIIPSREVSGIRLRVGEDAKFTFSLQNIGANSATRVTPICDVEITEAGTLPRLHLVKTSPRKIFLSPGSASAWNLPITIPAEKLTREALHALASNRKTLRVYGVALFNDGFCRRCVNFCYLFEPNDKSEVADEVTGGVARCEELPDCSPYGNFNECPNSDVSDTLGYYPASEAP